MDLLTVSAVDRLKDSRDLEVDRAKTERDERLVTYFFRGRGLDADDGIGSSRRGADIGESAQMLCVRGAGVRWGRRRGRERAQFARNR